MNEFLIDCSFKPYSYAILIRIAQDHGPELCRIARDHGPALCRIAQDLTI
jgi:hypothetical protein